MHREIRNRIEDVLAAKGDSGNAASGRVVSGHLGQCAECREALSGMREQAAWLRELRAPENLDLEPRPGFYARVLQRIEAEGPVSIWYLFIESAFGRRIAIASLALALLAGVYVVTAERAEQERILNAQAAPIAAPGPVFVIGEDAPGRVITQMGQSVDSGQSSADAVLANLVSYRDQ